MGAKCEACVSAELTDELSEAGSCSTAFRVCESAARVRKTNGESEEGV